MEYTVNRTEPNKADIHLTFTAEDIAGAYEKAYQKAASKIKINGFRPGKAPLAMVKKTLGDSVAEDAITILLNDSLADIYPKLEFKPYSQPNIQIEKFEKGSTLIAKASLELGPEVKLGNYKNLSVNTYEPEILDSDVEPHLEEIRFALAKTQAKEEGDVVESNDFIELELHAKDAEGHEIQRADKSPYFLGRHSENFGLEAHFLGLKQGEEKDFDYEYPSDYPNPDVAGRKLSFHVLIHSVYKVILPEINDDLARDYSEETPDLETLKSNIRKGLDMNLQKELKDYYVNKLIQNIVENSEFHFPASLIKEEAAHLFEREMSRVYGANKITMEEFSERAKISMDQLNEIYSTKALQNLKNYFVLMEIAKAENLEVDEKKFNDSLSNYLSHQDKKAISNQKVNEAVRSIHDSLLFEKIFDFLIENADKKVDTGISLNNTRKILSER